MKYYIKGARLISPGNKIDEILDIVIEEGRVRGLKSPEAGPAVDAQVIDGKGKWLVPGLIDLHVHFRDPGQTYKEDIFTGLKASGAGGFTKVCCMPNTSPVLDSKDVITYVDERARRACGVKLFVVSAISKGLLGQELVDIEELVNMDSLCRPLTGRGIAAISDDGKSVADDDLMLKAMIWARKLKVPVFSHAEEELAMVRRDIGLAEKAGGHLHFCHISSREAIDAIRQAKAKGLRVTAEASPHHFSLTQDFLKGTGGRGKVNPPLRTEEDRQAVIEGLKDGSIDAIATDHAPHAFSEKEVAFEEAAFGFIGLETSFALAYTLLVEGGHLTPLKLIEKMSLAPAKILGIEGGIIAEGMLADLALIDVEKEYQVDPETFFSKGRSTPFKGMRVRGKNLMTFVEGRLIYNDGSFD